MTNKPDCDIALFDDDGVTAIYAMSMHAKEVVRRVSDLDIIWTDKNKDDCASIGAVALCSACFVALGQELSNAGLVVVYPFEPSKNPSRRCHRHH
jgi:hypothetical protein